MQMNRFALILVVAGITSSCTEKAAEKPAAAKPAEPPVVAKPVEAKLAKPTDLIAKHSMTPLAAAGDEMAQFSLGDGAGTPGCEQYTKDLASFFAELQDAYKSVQEDMQKGNDVDPFERFGARMKQAAEKLKLVKTTPELQPINDQIVAGVFEMADGWIDLSAAVRRQDQAASDKATARIEAANKNLESAFTQLKKACGG